jgi:hypothetical protein
VDFGDHPDCIHSPGPNVSHYDQFRAKAGAHLIFNAFWTIQHFCVHQMLMSDPMHQVDLGAIVHLIRAILRKFQECVETALAKPGLLFEFHAENYQALQLPAIPSTSSSGSIHKLLKTDNVWPDVLSSTIYSLIFAYFD